MSKPSLVAVAMSGGVDSSVAAALLKERGYSLVGLMLRLWSEPGREDENQCCTPDAVMQARRVAARLGFPFYVIDSREYFYKTIVQSFIEGYESGMTPNPCMSCNEKVRWGFLLEQARGLGAEFLATGHYARLQRDDSGRFSLLQAKDVLKDQSYVLSRLNQQQLEHSLFPLGDYLKTEVRAIAQKYNLETAQRKESQDLCFLGHKDYREFLTRNSPKIMANGKIVNRKGEILGEHRGLASYTIGQRKGLGIAVDTPLFVIEKDQKNNRLVVGYENELSFTELIATDANWIAGTAPASDFKAEVKIRYKAKLSPATITIIDEKNFQVSFDEPLRDITPGQYAVIYDGDVVLGSGVIRKTHFEGNVI
ncbi:MAG: tRNA 2-thiouridine(34) synthase MnmA [Anaerolineae bacterium]|nr:tRNA 2-thiouridine(34) synthase MnmA [Anaerolineae bacterium]